MDERVFYYAAGGAGSGAALRANLESFDHWRITQRLFEDVSVRSLKVPLLVKGVLHPEEASDLMDCGADGIIVSNHGGRHRDGAISALDALPAIAEKVGSQIPVLFDSGIRHGADIYEALSLGAKMVFFGRPYIYALTLAGESGVRRLLENIIADFDLNLGISGVRDVHALNRNCLVRSNM
ncbi:alpha-hydroxy-acid oxidizing protein [Paenibacillus sp. S-38]|uniref:alpha-hydroxy-acid oxidizing protein n=1 Tax=Paenibacillus sp. S-38 TaxID=3416710 RepID=UPI003CF34990